MAQKRPIICPHFPTASNNLILRGILSYIYIYILIHNKISICLWIWKYAYILFVCRYMGSRNNSLSLFYIDIKFCRHMQKILYTDIRQTKTSLIMLGNLIMLISSHIWNDDYLILPFSLSAPKITPEYHGQSWHFTCRASEWGFTIYWSTLNLDFCSCQK